MLTQEETRRSGHICVGAKQFFIEFIGEGTGEGAKVLEGMGVTLRDARMEVEQLSDGGMGLLLSKFVLLRERNTFLNFHKQKLDNSVTQISEPTIIIRFDL